MKTTETFNPDVRCRVHDRLTDEIFEWEPKWAASYREFATPHDVGLIEFDGMLLDGWSDCMAID